MQVNPQEVSGEKATTPAEQLLRPANGKARSYSVKRSELTLLGTRGNGPDCVFVVPLDDHDHLLKDLIAEQRRYRALIAILRNSFPLLDDHGLDEDEHHCEWHIQRERMRLHAILDGASADQQQGGAE